MRRAGRKSAALPVVSASFVLAAILGLVVLTMHRLLDLLEEPRVRFLPVLTFGVLLRTLLTTVACLHQFLPCSVWSDRRTR